jgi:hypothetical protein
MHGSTSESEHEIASGLSARVARRWHCTQRVPAEPRTCRHRLAGRLTLRFLIPRWELPRITGSGGLRLSRSRSLPEQPDLQGALGGGFANDPVGEKNYGVYGARKVWH